MAYKITDECTACGTCMDTCPSDAIREGDPKYSIDVEACIECGACVDACPAEAIVEE
jgi:formate hydrogenlyase subunit 6/NADH:ubiquinone oxidoreductase subunit I